MICVLQKRGDLITLGKIKIETILTCGPTVGGISFKVGQSVFSGEAIFAGSMGRANSTWKDFFNAVSQNLLTLTFKTRLYPDSGPFNTVGEEKLHNLFFYDNPSYRNIFLKVFL